MSLPVLSDLAVTDFNDKSLALVGLTIKPVIQVILGETLPRPRIVVIEERTEPTSALQNV